MKRLFVDPSYPVFNKNKLFDASDRFLNRDNTLLPFIKLKSDFEKKGIEVLTYDLAQNFTATEIQGDGYINLGNTRDFSEVKNKGLRMLGYYLMEPPLVAKHLYDQLPTVSKYFEKIYLHNITGNCYSLEGLDVTKIEKLYVPEPLGEVVEKYWNKQNRLCKIVIINGHHKPKGFPKHELYSQRIKWGLSLNKFIEVHLFGRGWKKRVNRNNLWGLFIFNYFKIMNIYKGECENKLEVLSNYDYALCFENLNMDGYITEKIFDCFYAGTIPIYWGAQDIAKYIPKEAYIDRTEFKNSKELANYLSNLSSEKKNEYKIAAKNFLSSESAKKFLDFTDSVKY